MLRAEAGVLLLSEVEEAVHAEALCETVHVEEVPWLGAAEQGEDLVGSELFLVEDWPERGCDRGPESGVPRQVDQGVLGPVGDTEADEGFGGALDPEGERSLDKRGFQSGAQGGDAVAAASSRAAEDGVKDGGGR